jgi:hypothetical protein
MDERGWGWNSSEIRQVRLVEWISRQEGDSCRVSEFYDSLPDQTMNRWNVAHDNLTRLENRSLILQFFEGGGGTQGMEVLPAPQMRDLAEEMQDRRANRSARRVACRDAMIAWLWSHDALNPACRQVREEILKEPRYGVWFAEPFSDVDLDTASGWLQRQGLVDGVSVEQADGPVLLFLTAEGAECAERFESNTVRWQETKQMSTVSGMTVNISGDNHGQVARDYAHQSQNTGDSADHLQELIIGLAELVHAFVPNAANLLKSDKKRWLPSLAIQ